MKFVKMHGCGNDYVYLDGVSDAAVAARIEQPGWVELVRKMSDRHKGIGSDGVIVLCPPTSHPGSGTGSSSARGDAAHVRMRMFNADGSESEMCGNGIRCVAKFAHDRLGIRASPMLVQTGRGVMSITYRAEVGKLVEATVDMLEPVTAAAALGLNEFYSRSRWSEHEYKVNLDGDTALSAVLVSMGNPHAVFFIEKEGDGPNAILGGQMMPRGQLITLIDLSRWGPRLERNGQFGKPVNAHLVQVWDRQTASVRSWERGSGITQACGTGACASLVAGVLTGRLDRAATMRVPGGELQIRWNEATNHIFMTGPAEDICEGTWLGQSAPATNLIQARTLSTRHLILRPFKPEDAPEVSRLAGDRRIAEMTLRLPHPYELHHAQSWVVMVESLRAAGKAVVMAICEKDGRLVGATGLEIDRTHERAELGYWIGVEHWGKGYATEAAIEMVRYGFETLNLSRIFAQHYAANPASGRVLEKAGLKREGLLVQHVRRMGVVHDSVLHGITRADWAAAQKEKS